MSRKYLNLVLHDLERRMYPLCRIDICKHLFYANSETAQAAAAAATEENKTTSKRGVIYDCWKRLPPPAINFQATPSLLNSRMVYMFSLLGGEVNVLYADPRCHTALYNFEMKFVQSIPSPNSSKRPNVISVSIPQAADPADPMNQRESLYVLDLSPTTKIDRCFEVFCYREMRWRWDILPPPPFFRDPYMAPDLYSYAAVGSSTTCISSLQDQSIGTYAFDTVCRRWRRVADWVLPFFGKAEYVPELSLWVGLSACNPFTSLSALDLSAMDSAHPPVPRHTLEYLDPPEEDEGWSPTQLHLLNLGSGRFCVATFFGTMLRTCPYYGPPLRMRACPDPLDPYSSDDEEMDEKEYAVFTGLEVKRNNDADGSLQLIKHMSRRYTVGSRNIECVL